MKILNPLLLVVMLGGLFGSCKKEDPLNISDVDNIPGLGGDTWAPGTIDKWIFDSLTVPYNIAVKYKWDQFELELDRTIVPIKEEKIIPVMRAVKKVFLDTYTAEAGIQFIKKYSPKNYVLLGSGSYNADGSVNLGQAEGGRKIIIFQLNYFRAKDMSGYVPSDSLIIKQLFQTIHHEFGHVLHQGIYYTPDYTRISKSLYTTDWINYSDAEANQNGFVTKYSMSQPDDDFVEMIAIMLTEGRAGFDKIVNSIPAGTSTLGTTQALAKKNLRDKEAIIVNYFKQAWNIDFYSLQLKTRAAVAGLLY